MPRLTTDEHKKRKAATRVFFHDKDGKPLSDAHKSVAVQDKRDSCDVNRIIKRAKLPNGQIDMNAVFPLVKGQGVYGDFTSAVDFQEQANRVIRMNNAFMQLAPNIRQKFNNDPAQLVAYLDKCKVDQATREEAISLGILPKPKIEHTRLETPEGNFWVTTRDGVEIARNPIKTAAPSPGA